MSESERVSNHYTHGELLGAIHEGVRKLGKSTKTICVDDLAPIDEFHIGGRKATEQFLVSLDLTSDDHVLDVGCGLGGAGRFVVDRYGCKVTGIDLTDEYIQTGRALCDWVGLANSIHLETGDATDMTYADGVFDKAYLMHVGMNIADKHRLAAELFRVLRPGGRLGIYDIMSLSDDTLTFPVPWASSPEGSAVSPIEQYKQVLTASGFQISGENDRSGFALQFFEQLMANAANADGPPPLGIHILMGESAKLILRNMIENVSAGRIAPVEIFADKAM